MSKKEIPCRSCGQDMNIPAKYNAENIARLLAVARAAKDVYSTGFVQMFHQADGRHFYLVPVDDMEELRDKLDAVEDLL